MPEPFNPMADLQRMLDAHFHGDAAPPEPETPDGAPEMIVLNLAEAFSNAAAKPTHATLGHMSARVLQDTGGDVFDAARRAGGLVLQLQTSLMDADNRPGEGLYGQAYTLYVVGTHTGYHLVTEIEMDDDPANNRLAVTSLSALGHRMWHLIAGTRCSSGGVLLAGDTVMRGNDGKSAREILADAVRATIGNPNTDAHEDVATLLRALERAALLLDQSSASAGPPSPEPEP